jgi:twitching motility two-component system response regulator PilG
VSDGLRTVQGELTDISVGGCRVLADEAFPVDTDCRLAFTLPDGTHIDGVSIAVCNCARYGSRHSLGCTFSDRDELAWNDIEFYVATTLTRVRGEAPGAASILILDAQPRSIHAARTMLEREGYDVATTQSAVDAFFMLRMHAPDLFLVNQAIPDMDAATLCATLRASRRFEALPIVIYGGNPAKAQPVLDAGANEYVEDLMPTPELRERIERYTDSENPPQAAAG